MLANNKCQPVSILRACMLLAVSIAIVKSKTPPPYPMKIMPEYQLEDKDEPFYLSTKPFAINTSNETKKIK